MLKSSGTERSTILQGFDLRELLGSSLVSWSGMTPSGKPDGPLNNQPHLCFIGNMMTDLPRRSYRIAFGRNVIVSQSLNFRGLDREKSTEKARG